MWVGPVRAVRHRQGCQPSRDSVSVPKKNKLITSSGPSIEVERRTRDVWWTRLFFCDCRYFGLFLPSIRFDAVRCDSLRCALPCSRSPSFVGVRFVVEESSRVPGRLYGRDRAGVASPRRGGEIDGSRRSVVTTFGLGSRCPTTRLLPEEDAGETSVELVVPAAVPCRAVPSRPSR